MPKIRKVVTVRLVAEVADTDDWATEYGFDPADIDSIQSDVGEWLHTAVTTVITELPGIANGLLVTSVEAQVVESTVTDPRTEWEVAELAHISTGQTIAPDEQTGDEWVVERGNAHYPNARVSTTYAVVRYAVDEEGNRIDTVEIPDEDAHPSWRYEVQDMTEFLISTEGGEDFWGGSVESAHIEYGDGSHSDYDTEEKADAECRRMAEHDASISGAITWDGIPAV